MRLVPTLLPTALCTAALTGMLGGAVDAATAARSDAAPSDNGRYLGQPAPGLQPQVFAPGLVSTSLSEYSTPVFSPDGNEVLYSVADGEQHVVMRLRRSDGRWIGPEVAPFSGRYSDELPVYSADGSAVFFQSKRPVSMGGSPMAGFLSWVVERGEDGWGVPRRLPELDLCVVTSCAEDGTLYCHSWALDGAGGWDLFTAESSPQGFTEPVNLGPVVNSSGHETRPSIAPDNRSLLFHASRRPQGGGPMISFRAADGRWSEPHSLGDAYEADANDRYPAYSPDGSAVLFVGWRFREFQLRSQPLSFDELLTRLNGPQNLRFDVYWLDARILDRLRPVADGTLIRHGDYLGQQPPGRIPQLFGPGTVSTGIHEHSGANFSPAGNELFFVAAGATHHTLVRMLRDDDGTWSQPQVAPFSGRYPDDCPSFTPDGTRLYFQSRRPRDGGIDPAPTWGTWYAERTGSGWSDPVLDKDLTAMEAITPSYAGNGNVYFARRDPDRPGGPDLWLAEPLPDGGYGEPRRLGPAVNSEHFEAWHYIHPDEHWLMFSSYGRSTGDGLFISFRNPDGSWQPARWMGQAINGGGQTRMPRLSPDGRYLFFNRSGSMHADYSERTLSYRDLVDRALAPRNGPGDIWWVDAAIIEEVRAIDRPDLRAALLEALDQEGIDAAIALYKQLTAQHPDYYDLGEDTLNGIAYHLLGSGRTTEAIAIFELNTEIYPDRANPWDSLAEAYRKSGETEAAVAACRRALAIEPNKPTAARMLGEMTGK